MLCGGKADAWGGDAAAWVAQRGAVDVQAAGRLERALMIVQRLGVDVEAV